ncbi:hypothetical protein JOC24_006523 [Streptomyces sp. HB132]|nr:hypothetical protein [Streptomyces sp. HB132]
MPPGTQSVPGDSVSSRLTAESYEGGAALCQLMCKSGRPFHGLAFPLLTLSLFPSEALGLLCLIPVAEGLLFGPLPIPLLYTDTGLLHRLLLPAFGFLRSLDPLPLPVPCAAASFPLPLKRLALLPGRLLAPPHRLVFCLGVGRLKNRTP